MMVFVTVWPFSARKYWNSLIIMKFTSKIQKKSMQKQLVFIGPKVRGSQNRLFPCVIRGSENEKNGSENSYKTLLFWEVPKKSSQNLRNSYNYQKVIKKMTWVENDVSESCQNRRNTNNSEPLNSGRKEGLNFWPRSLIILIVFRNCWYSIRRRAQKIHLMQKTKWPGLWRGLNSYFCKTVKKALDGKQN